MLVFCGVLIGVAIGATSVWAAKPDAVPQTPLTATGEKFEARYAEQLEQLRKELTSKLPQADEADAETIDIFLASDALDAKLVKFVVLHDATPRGLAEFAQQGKGRAALVEKLLADTDLMKRMLVADGASAKKQGRSFGPEQYGPAMEIYTAIQKTSEKAASGVLNRLALAVALEHSVPIVQQNPKAATNAPKFIDPVGRYLHYEKAYVAGELDPAFDQLSAWDLRFVVNGGEPNEALAWGREMLRNFRPDHILTPNEGWRYVKIVSTDVKYGSGEVKHDRPELQRYQNILMNGGVCGRRAFFGRFILRAFGIPTTARPSRGHAALAHWTPEGWVVNLGGAWGCGWASGPYDRSFGRKKDLDFLAITQARANRDAFLKVKRARWAGDVLGEERIYGESQGSPAFWNGVALKTQREIIEKSKTVTLEALGTDLGEANEPTVAEAIMASPVMPEDTKITLGAGGVITIPAAAYTKPEGNTREVIAMKGFHGGMQVFLPRFFPQGKTILRGGTWKNDPDGCTSGCRLLSGGYGRYENWGLRVAVTPTGDETPRELTLDLGDGVSMELVYIEPGTFVMGGESTTDGRFQCVEVPKHEVILTKGFYLGKHEVTQAQYQAIMGSNPSKSTKGPNCPVDNVSEGDAIDFCAKLAEKTGHEARLPTEAEWEYASRAGADTKWFFGSDPAKLGEYAWFKGNADARSHPVGQKKPNPWGLYDIYGNVCERISDKYARNYYSISPKQDPTGPSQGVKSRLEYQVTVQHAGKYALAARVVTPRDNQRLNVAVNESKSKAVIELPFTLGKWQDSKPVTLELEAGENTLRLWRDQPPQYGVAIKEFSLKPVK